MSHDHEGSIDHVIGLWVRSWAGWFFLWFMTVHDSEVDRPKTSCTNAFSGAALFLPAGRRKVNVSHGTRKGYNVPWRRGGRKLCLVDKEAQLVAREVAQMWWGSEDHVGCRVVGVARQ
jgi:hypothetical protein